MAKQDSSAESGGTEIEGAPTKSLPILPLLNSVALLAAVGFMYYSKLLYKRPTITESSERKRLAETHASPTPPPVSLFLNFEPIVLNIKPIPAQPLPADGTTQQIQGKLHYATVGFSLEIRDSGQKDLVESLRPLILDKLIQILGKKQFHELTTVQGRYILTSEMIDFTNHLINVRSTKPSKDPLVTNVYFNQFTIQ